MRNQIVILLAFAIALCSLTSCEKIDLVESPLITISEPISGTTFKKDDYIPVVFDIETDGIGMKSYGFVMKYKRGGKEVGSTTWGSGEEQVEVDTDYFLTKEVNRDVIFEVCADLEDGTTACESVEIRFEK